MADEDFATQRPVLTNSSKVVLANKDTSQADVWATSAQPVNCRFRYAKTAIVVSCFIIACVAVAWRLSETCVLGPKVAFASSECEFQNARTGTVVESEFLLQNKGWSKLLIDKVAPDCGCSIVKLSKKELLPGEEATLHVSLSLKDHRGTISRRILVYTSDRCNPVAALMLKGEASYDIRVEPKEARLTAMGTSYIDIEPAHSRSAFRITGIHDVDSAVTASLEDRGRGEYRIHLESKERQRGGRPSFGLRIETDHPLESTITVPVHLIN